MSHAKLCEAAAFLSRHLRQNLPVEDRQGRTKGGNRACVLGSTIHTMEAVRARVAGMLPPPVGISTPANLNTLATADAFEQLRYACGEVERWIGHSCGMEPGDVLDEVGPISIIVLEKLDAAVATLAEDEPETSEPQEIVSNPPKPKTSVNARMLAAVQDDLNKVSGWTAKQWSEHLKCAPSTVVDTATWKNLAMARERLEADHAKSHRRKPKASDQRRD